jgi:hypothetical protein
VDNFSWLNDERVTMVIFLNLSYPPVIKHDHRKRDPFSAMICHSKKPPFLLDFPLLCLMTPEGRLVEKNKGELTI